jgi:hypothetical protein
LHPTGSTAERENIEDMSQNPTSVRIDELCRIVAGQLVSGPHTHPQAAQKEIDRLRSSQLRAEARKGSNNQWFAVIEDSQGNVALLSNALNTQDSARNAATEAIRLIKR